MNQSISKIEGQLKEQYDSIWQIGVSTLTYSHDPVKAIKEMLNSDQSVRRIELGLARRVRFGKYIEELLKLKENNNLEYSVHIPFLYDDLAHPHPAIRENNINEAKRSIELADIVQASWVVVHPGHQFFDQILPAVPELEPLKEPRESYLANSQSSIRELSRYSASRNIDLCVENLPFGLGQTEQELQQLSSDSINTRFLLDIGHAHISRTLSELLRLEPTYFHFHDNEGKEDQHLKLGAGNLDLRGVIEKMISQGGTKYIIFELYTLNDIRESLSYLGNILDHL